MEVIKLLITVSGGLEDLAEDQINSHFGNVLLNKLWQRRTSGSQLYLDLKRSSHDDTDTAHVIANAIKKLDFVEYVYILVVSFIIPDDVEKGDARAPAILSLIDEATCNIPKSSIDICMEICDNVNKQNSSEVVDVGLSSLPGIFLPAPDVQVSDLSVDCANANCTSFAVNTIYTKKDVSKAIVTNILEFVEQYSEFSNEGLWLDAGSGDGSLLDNLPAQNSIGVDTHPASPNVHCMDFLQLSRKWLQEKCPHKELYVISNPPFSVSSRGDYTPIISFINHSIEVLDAKFVAVICPSKFARERIWKSLGLTDKAYLWARFLLPQNSFYDPATGKSVHIHSFCLIFGDHKMPEQNTDAPESIHTKSGCHITAKRDKGSFREISTAELTACIVSGLRQTGMELVAERNAKYMLNAKLLESSFELWWQINPMQPCSSVNSNCARITNHSMGWISLSVKPAVALTMTSLAIKKEQEDSKGCIVVNLMSGEGTIELEASRAVDDPIFMISGDIRFDCALKTSERIAALKASRNDTCLIDLVAWDAQNLPLRKGFADAILGDLPIQGTSKKTHQQPKIGNSKETPNGPTSALKYSSVFAECSRILSPKGRASFVSVDYRSLGGACKKFNWTSLNHGASINLGGLTGKLFLIERNEPCSKDLCLTVPLGSTDFSSWLLELASIAFATANEDCLERKTANPVVDVQLLNSFFHPEEKYLRHCYRFTFHDEIRNSGAKMLEKEIRRAVCGNLLEGMSL